MSISNLDELRDHLQTAVEIEWSTIPPYLCALWSIEEGTNVEASEAIEDVVISDGTERPVLIDPLINGNRLPGHFTHDRLEAHKRQMKKFQRSCDAL